jgi:hypothetical protein
MHLHHAKFFNFAVGASVKGLEADSKHGDRPVDNGASFRGTGSDKNAGQPNPGGVGGKSSERNSTKVSDSNRTKFRNALQLSTVDDGFNSGRVYYLKAASERQCEEITADLLARAKSARKLAERKTRLQRWQTKVLRFYESNPFQIGVAFLIVTVGMRGPGSLGWFTP